MVRGGEGKMVEWRKRNKCYVILVQTPSRSWEKEEKSVPSYHDCCRVRETIHRKN